MIATSRKAHALPVPAGPAMTTRTLPQQPAATLTNHSPVPATCRRGGFWGPGSSEVGA